MTKIFIITVKDLEPATSYVRDQGPTTAPARHMSESRSLNWDQFMLHWFIRFPEFAEFTELNESSAPFRKNSIVLKGVFHEVLFIVELFCVLGWN